MKMLTIARPRTSVPRPWPAMLWTILLLAPTLAHSAVWYDRTPMFKYGAVYARSIVLNEAGNPTYVEYDKDGKEITSGIQVEITPDKRDYVVMSGAAFRATVAQYQQLHAQHPDGELLTRAAYLSRNFVTLDQTPIQKPNINPGTLHVYVRAANQLLINNPDQIILGQFPMDVTLTIAANTQSLLLKPDGTLVEQSPHNIGPRVGFYEDFNEDNYFWGFNNRQPKDKIYGPLAGLNVEVGTAWQISGGTPKTDSEGRYTLSVARPPCLGYESFEVNVYLELYYQRFNPRGTGNRSYQLRRIDYESCRGSILPSGGGGLGESVGQNIAIIAGNSGGPYKPPKDFPIDLMVLSGRASIANDFKGVALASGPTQYNASDVDKTRKTQQHYDFDGDGTADQTILGHLIDVPIANSTATEKQFSSNTAEHPCSPDPETGPTVCNKQGVYLSSSGKTPGQDQPDLVRAADINANLTHQGLLSEIAPEDFKNTDIYVVRESNGQLIAERQGLPIDEMDAALEWYEGNTQDLGVDQKLNRFFYTLLMRGQGEGFYNEVTLNQSFNQWQAVGGVAKELHEREADHLRPGEKVKIIAINRATGYIGSITTTMQAAGSKTSSQISFPIDDIILRPPNLKIWAERNHTVQSGLTAGEKRDQLIGSEGAGLGDDTSIIIYTDWLDHDGTPLPAALADFGYTGRLAKVTAPNQLSAAGNAKLSQFAIKPGFQTQVIKLSEEGFKREHLYVQVSGEPSSRNPDFPFVSDKRPDFESSGLHEGVLKYRPNTYVPVKVPLYDEDNSLLQEQAYQLAKLNNPNIDLTKPEAIYQFVYRPEFQFSVFDLKLQQVQRKKGEATENLLTSTQPTISSGDDMVNLLYNLYSNENDPLDLFSGERELVFAFGEEEIQAKIGENQQISFQNIEHLASLDPEDFLSIRLYANNDTANILWEWAFFYMTITVDNNRNGLIEFNDSDIPEGDLTDQTSASNPFRFWVNNDYDVVKNRNKIELYWADCPNVSVENKECELFDEDPSLGSNIDSAHDQRIDNILDLEDFAPMALTISADRDLQGNVLLPSGYSMEISAKGLGINLFEGVWEQGIEYLTNNTVAIKQVNDIPESPFLHKLQDGVPWKLNQEDLNRLFKKGNQAKLIFEGTKESPDTCKTNSENCYLEVTIKEGQRVAFSNKAYINIFDMKNYYDHYSAGRGGNPGRVTVDEADLDVALPDFVAEYLGFENSGGGASFSGDVMNPGPVQSLENINTQSNHQYIEINNRVDSEKDQPRDYILLVHGWRMLYPERVSFAETAFKRLYWQGFKGRLGLFSWPTGYFDKAAYDYGADQLKWAALDPQNYGNSEVVARESQSALYNALTQINLIKEPTEFNTINIVAHSMGNVVVSEMLRQNNAGAIVDTYVASQAADSGSAYGIADALEIGVSVQSLWALYNDTNHAPFTDEYIDRIMPPNLYQYNSIPSNRSYYPGVRDDWGAPYYTGINDGVEIFNFYNIEDAALSGWKINQITKPDGTANTPLRPKYRHALQNVSCPAICSIDCSLCEDSVVADIFTHSVDFNSSPSNLDYSIQSELNTILAHTITSRSVALGAGRITGSSVIPSGNNIDLGKNSLSGFGKSNYDHSAQFLSTYQRRYDYWRKLVTLMKVDTIELKVEP